MINIWVGVSLIHSRPSTTSANRSGSASRSGRCGFIVSGVALKRRDRTGERAGHLAMKWRGSSGSEWQSLQVGLLPHVIRGTHDVTGSRHEDILTFISPATEKLEKQDKFQPRDKSYLYNITQSAAEPLKDGFPASVANPKAAAFSLRKLNFVTADISHMSFGNPSELFLLARICFVRLMDDM